MEISKGDIVDDFELLSRFNKREDIAFGKIYDKIYREIFFYAQSVFNNSGIDPKDIIHDIFVDIWLKKSIHFHSIKDLKSYLYVTIKNRCRAHYNRVKVVDKAHKYFIKNEDIFIVQAAEAEIFSPIASALKLLPLECAKTFKMFLEGMSAKEIAVILNKKESTIYNQRREAIAILREKIPRDKFLTLIMLLS